MSKEEIWVKLFLLHYDWAYRDCPLSVSYKERLEETFMEAKKQADIALGKVLKEKLELELISEAEWVASRN